MNEQRLPSSRALVGLGANLGEPLVSLPAALVSLALLPGVRLVEHSRAYRTPPFDAPPSVSGRRQPDYWNAACELEFTGDPRVLLEHLHEIERRFGRDRVREGYHGARHLDLDLLLHGERRFEGERLRLPHPGVEERLFVLEPLCDLRPGLVLPSGRLARERADELRRVGQDLHEVAELDLAASSALDTLPARPTP